VKSAGPRDRHSAESTFDLIEAAEHYPEFLRVHQGDHSERDENWSPRD
jgi:ribosome-associated toxin RatA of RatAB toxin-antitoxin module